MGAPVSSLNLLRASLGCGVQSISSISWITGENSQTGAYYFAQEPFAGRMVSVLESAVC